MFSLVYYYTKLGLVIFCFNKNEDVLCCNCLYNPCTNQLRPLESYATINCVYVTRTEHCVSNRGNPIPMTTPYNPWHPNLHDTLWWHPMIPIIPFKTPYLEEKKKNTPEREAVGSGGNVVSWWLTTWLTYRGVPHYQYHQLCHWHIPPLGVTPAWEQSVWTKWITNQS